MQRTKGQYNVVSLPAKTDAETPGYFSKGNPITGAKATKVTADFLNMIQEELAGLVTGAGLTLDVNNNAQVLAAVNALINARKVVIQDYTVVGNVGDALQTFAGRDYTLAELQAYFTAQKVISYNRFGAGAALVTDEVGAYNYTLGAGAKAPVNANGIMGTAFGIQFAGGQYATHATKFNDFNTMFSGAGKGLIHSFWLYMPLGATSGAGYLYTKGNSAVNDYYVVHVDSPGVINFITNGSEATGRNMFAQRTIPLGANTNWYHIVTMWNTTFGKKMFINKKCEATDYLRTTLMANNGAGGTPLLFGAAGTGVTGGVKGTIANEVIINDVGTQAMVDFLYASTIPLPQILQSAEFELKSLMRPQAAVGGERQVYCDEVMKRATDVLIGGGTRVPTDYYRYLGRI